MSRRAGFHPTEQLLRKTNTITPNVPLLLLLPTTLCTEHDVTSSEISLWSLGIPYPGCDRLLLPTFHVPPTSLPAWPYKMQKRAHLCKPCSAITKTSLYYQLNVLHKSKTQSHNSYCEESKLHPSPNQHTDSLFLIAPAELCY